VNDEIEKLEQSFKREYEHSEGLGHMGVYCKTGLDKKKF
jgi:hypothetical protein